MLKKSGSKAARKSKPGISPTAPLPDGFTRIATGNFPPTYDFKVNPVLQGNVVEIKTIQVKKGRKLEDTQIMSVADQHGEIHSVWVSAALEGLFKEAKKKDVVYIRYDGPIEIKGRKEPMKGFTTGIKPAKGAKKGA